MNYIDTYYGIEPPTPPAGYVWFLQMSQHGDRYVLIPEEGRDEASA